MSAIRESRGFTLIELLIATTIVAIIAALALPSFARMLSISERRSEVSDLVSVINLARNTAVFEQTTVTLCPVNESMRCTRDWSLPLAAFRDPERRARISDQSQIIRIRKPESTGSLRGATGIHTYFRFNPSGFAWGAIGNITWCPKNGDATLAAQIRINMGGRPKLAKDRDSDGIIEDSGGHPVTCT